MMPLLHNLEHVLYHDRADADVYNLDIGEFPSVPLTYTREYARCGTHQQFSAVVPNACATEQISNISKKKQ